MLGLCLGTAHALSGAAGTARGALAFLPLWAVGSGINMYVGLREGRSAASEIPFLFVVFAIPAAAAFAVWWMLTHG